MVLSKLVLIGLGLSVALSVRGPGELWEGGSGSAAWTVLLALSAQPLSPSCAKTGAAPSW